MSHEDERPDGVEETRDDFVEALAAAVRPRELPADVHESILARVLGATEEPPASAGEQRSADELRERLLARDLSHPLVALASAVRVAAAPGELPALTQARLVRDAARAPRAVVVRRTAVVVGFVVSAAAALLLWVTRPAPPSTEAALPAPGTFLPGMVETRSTTSLFSPEDFPREGGQSARIDRIASERGADLRKNRFVAWGVP